MNFIHDRDCSVSKLADSDDNILQAARLESRRSIESMRVNTKATAVYVPTHPVPAMQSAFAESLVEATSSTAGIKPKLKFAPTQQRRRHLLNSPKRAKLHADLWRYRPGQKHHELWKLLAQISFGVHLLLNGTAESNEQVVDILQCHIDEIDEFMETTLEDVKIAIDDISDRVNYLKLLTDDMKTFEGLLEDHNFRLRIVKDNEVISHIVDRTTLALEATFKDIDQGLNAANEFAAYLDNQVNKPWRQQRPQIADTYNAMRGNAEGWHQVLMDIQARATLLDTVLVSLAQIIAELDLSVYIACGTTVTNTLPSDNIRRPETDP